MNYQNKGLQVSFVIHAIVFIIISGISNIAIPLAKPIVIDFNIKDSQGSGVKSQESAVRNQKSARPASRSEAGEVREQKTKIEKIEKKNEPPIPNPQSPISETHLPSISETQVPIPAPSEQDPTPKNEGRNLAAQSKADGLSAGRDAIGSTASGSSSGSSIEKAKMRYLKEHFAYIRKIVQKHLSYPKIARKMGWEGRVVISFVVEESGRVEDIRIIESSGIGLLDKNAVQTIIKASPFPKPPIKAALIIPVVYKLN